MAPTVLCARCGEQVARPTGADPRCPRCQAALPPVAPAAKVEPTGAAIWSQTEIPASHFPVPEGGYEDLELGPEPEEPEQAVKAAPPRPAAPLAEEVARRPPLSQSAIAASRMAAAPTFSSSRKKTGLPIVPLGIGVVAVIVITIYALTRGAPRAPAAPPTAPARTVAAESKAAEPVNPSPAPAAPGTAVAAPPVPAAEAGPGPAEPREPPRPAPTRPARNDTAAQVREPPRREPVVAAAAAVRTAAAPAVAPAPPAVAAPASPAPPVPAPEPAPPQGELFRPAQPAETPTATPLQIGPSYAREGMKKARLADPGCLAANLRLPRDLSLEGESATVKFAVDEKGAVSKYEYLAGPADGRVSVAIWNAIQRCEFLPGTSASGQPIPLWMTIPIRFGK